MNGENNNVSPVVPNTSASVTPVTPAQPATVSPVSQPVQEVTSNTIVMPPVNFSLNTVNPTEVSDVKKEEPKAQETVPPVDLSSTSVASTSPVNDVKVENKTDSPMLNPHGQIKINNGDDDSFVQEKLKTVEVEYNPPSKFKTFMMIFFFILILGFVIFLPDISNQIRLYKENKNKPPVEEFVSGKLICTLNTNTANLDKNYSRTFVYENNKLKSATFETETRGDITDDEKTLDALNAKCTILKESIAGLNGVTINCNYKDGDLIEREKFDYSSYDKEAVNAAYAEAELDMLEFEYEQDIDSIKTNMLQGGFSCNKEK